MRVLIVALVAALGGCYTPGVADCQFSCGAGEACPDGTSCIGGFCRTTTAGTCTGTAIDAAVDTPVDAPDDPSCPAPPQSGCGARFKLPGGTCAVVCGTEKWDDAANLCGNGEWELGKLDTIVKLDALNLQDALWIGASRTSGWTWRDGSPVAAALWTGGTAPTGGSTCGHVTVDRRLSNSHNCNDKLERLCTQR
jgi:hypothetical protein